MHAIIDAIARFLVGAALVLGGRNVANPPPQHLPSLPVCHVAAGLGPDAACRLAPDVPLGAP